MAVPRVKANHDLFEELRLIAAEQGARLGVTDCGPFDSVREGIVERVTSGASARLGFTFNDPELATSPRRSFPWASAIVVAAVPYLRDGDGRDDSRSVARFADGDRYDGVRHLLGELAAMLTDAGWRAEEIFDDDRLVDRAVAVRAGVAWWGKSSMALTPGLGPWFLIGSVVTDAPLEPTPPMDRSCGTCVACMPACPTDAIVAPGVVDARRCLAAVFQSRGAIDPSLRVAAGPRVYGCDACLTACPPGDRALEALEVGSTPSPLDLLSMSDRDLESLARHWFVPGRSMRFVRRNALVALANEQRPSHAGVLAGYLGHPDALLRCHAAWGLQRVGSEDALTILEVALENEADADVRDEIESSIAALAGHASANMVSTLIEPDRMS